MKCKDSKLCPGDITNSFFDALRSSAGQYKDGIQLLLMISTEKVHTACKYMQKGISLEKNCICLFLFVLSFYLANFACRLCSPYANTYGR